MKIAVGNNLVDEEGEITTLEVYASQGSGSFTVSSMESHEFTMADTSKVSLSDTLTIGGNNYESCVLKMKIPSACKVRIYAYTDSDPNFRLWQKSTTKDVYTTITDVKAVGFHVMEFEATKEDVYNVGCSNKVDMLTYFAVEFIY